jgi:hypothetical protein
MIFSTQSAQMSLNEIPEHGGYLIAGDVKIDIIIVVHTKMANHND